MAEQLQHDTGPEGGQPCRRCGLRYSPATAYVPCFQEGDTYETWFARQHPDIQKLLQRSADRERPEGK